MLSCWPCPLTGPVGVSWGPEGIFRAQFAHRCAPAIGHQLPLEERQKARLQVPGTPRAPPLSEATPCSQCSLLATQKPGAWSQEIPQPSVPTAWRGPSLLDCCAKHRSDSTKDLTVVLSPQVVLFLPISNLIKELRNLAFLGCRGQSWGTRGVSRLISAAAVRAHGLPCWGRPTGTQRTGPPALRSFQHHRPYADSPVAR